MHTFSLGPMRLFAIHSEPWAPPRWAVDGRRQLAFRVEPEWGHTTLRPSQRGCVSHQPANMGTRSTELHRCFCGDHFCLEPEFSRGHKGEGSEWNSASYLHKQPLHSREFFCLLPKLNETFEVKGQSIKYSGGVQEVGLL